MAVSKPQDVSKVSKVMDVGLLSKGEMGLGGGGREKREG